MPRKLPSCNRLYVKVDEFLGRHFERYGRFIARHPWKIILVIVVIDLGFAVGLLNLQLDSTIEQYAPTDSQSMKNRELVKEMFSIDTSKNFYLQSLVTTGKYAIVIVQKTDGSNILDPSHWSELSALVDYVLSTTINYKGENYNYTDICAKRFLTCVVDGHYVTSSQFQTMLSAQSIPYPVYSTGLETYSIDNTFAGATVSNGFLTSATAIKFQFHLANTNSGLVDVWLKQFLSRIKKYVSSNFSVVYAHSDSLDEELNANVSRDTNYFLVTLTLMFAFSGAVLIGGNSVSNRLVIGIAGVMSTNLAVIASVGIVSSIGVPFATIAGIMPFLVIGIGVDDMFIILSNYADTSPLDDVERRLGNTVKTCGIAVTITSLTDVIAFCAGASSVFPAIRNFCLFTGTAILFCYLNYMTFYLGCIVINEKRISQNRHFMTCKTVRTKEEMKKSGKSKISILFCSGSPNKNREELEGPLEKYPKRIIKKIITLKSAQIPILLIFGALIGVSIFGVTKFEMGLDQADLVTTDSYFYTFYKTDSTMYDFKYTVSLNVKSGVDYRLYSTAKAINRLRDEIKKDKDIDDSFFISWFHAYIESDYYDNSTEINFLSGLKSFLQTTSGNLYINDVTLEENQIAASRFHVPTEHLISPMQEADMMKRVRNIVEASSLPVFEYAPAFVLIEQWLVIFSQTMQTLAICLCVMGVITAIFLPIPIMIFLITVTVLLIMVSAVGFMHFWGLKFSSVTMVEIIMCIGFCVDFATHISHAFIQARGVDNDARIAHAVDRSGGPIFNGALSTIIGVLMLVFSKSFIFVSFFRSMFLVMVFGILYSMFFLPLLLLFFGPKSISVDFPIESEKTAEVIVSAKPSITYLQTKDSYTQTTDTIKKHHKKRRKNKVISGNSIQRAPKSGIDLSSIATTEIKGPAYTNTAFINPDKSGHDSDNLHLSNNHI